MKNSLIRLFAFEFSTAEINFAAEKGIKAFLPMLLSVSVEWASRIIVSSEREKRYEGKESKSDQMGKD